MSDILIKNSDIDCKDCLPNGWDITRIGDLVPITSSKRVFEEDWTTEGIPFYRAREIVLLSKYGYVDNQLFITPEKYNELKKISGIPKIGDILVTGVGTLGITHIVNDKKPFYFKDGNLIWIKINNKINPHFLNYLFQSKIIMEHIINSAPGTTVGTYTINSAKKTEIPSPCKKIQEKIVAYLNIETAKIDHKISILEQKFKKLEEYKQSVIFETVTKGLDSNIPMKDSGIEWIGEIPEHWEVKRVKDICKIQKGKAVEAFSERSEGMLPCIDTNFLRGRDNIVYCKTGLKVSPNKVLILWDGANAGELFFNLNVGYLGSTFGLFHTKLNNEFLYYYLKGIEQYSRDNLTGMGIPHVDGNVLKQTIALLPSHAEQERIVIHLNAQCLKFDKQRDIIKKKIELLKEYKKSVIYEAVTGKMEII